MIEIVYDRNEQAEESVFEGIILPKNIRQIGLPNGNRRIYIEDYVMTYLTQLANPNTTYARGAILVGESCRGENGEVIFVSGALPAQNLEFDLGETTFDGDTWSLIYQEVKTYFPDLEVVGWFLSRMGFSTEVNDMIVKLHMDNFAGNDKVLYIMDALEGEDAFYLMEGEYLRRQSGYYIYYARNEAMQNFMIESKGQMEPEEPNKVEKKDEAVVRNYKKILQERERHARVERMNKRLTGVCSGLTVAVLALTIAVLSNYQMLEKMESKLIETGVLTASVGETENKDLIWWENQSEGERLLDDNPETTSVTVTTGNKEKEGKKEKTKADSRDVAIANLDKVKAVSADLPEYYVVQNGDTLSSISFKMYNSVGYVAELMEANGFGEADEIHEGDRIVIPTVN